MSAPAPVAAAARRDRGFERVIDCRGIDVGATLSSAGAFRRDPTLRRWERGLARAILTPCGPGTLELRWCSAREGGDVVARAWGPGAGWLLDAAPSWLGLGDDPSGFDPTTNERLSELWRRRSSFRLGGSGVVWQELAATIIGQRVTALDAARSWARIVWRWGTVAPGPHGLRLPPTPAAMAARSYVELHAVGLERRRADALVLAARRADRLEEAASMPVADALGRLSALPGLGPWTATATSSLTHGDADTVIVGDYGIPTFVSYAFTGSARRVDDDAMLELLAPFAGHRWRVVRLLTLTCPRPPRRAPRVRNPVIARL